MLSEQCMELHDELMGEYLIHRMMIELRALGYWQFY